MNKQDSSVEFEKIWFMDSLDDLKTTIILSMKNKSGKLIRWWQVFHVHDCGGSWSVYVQAQSPSGDVLVVTLLWQAQK